MRIPPSVIVMSLVTAVPFGRAIRQTVKKHDRKVSLHDLSDDDLSSDEQMEKYAAEEARMQAEQERTRAEEKAKRAEAMRAIFGSDPATLAIKVGDSRLADWSEAVTRAPGYGANRNATTVTVHGDEICEELPRTLDQRWGASMTHLWTSPATHQRALLDDISCTVTFEPYAELDAWVGKTDAVIALDMIGQSATKLKDKLGGRVQSDDEGILEWNDLGVVGGKGSTTATAFTRNGKVVALEVAFDTDAKTLDALEERITKVVGGKPVRDDDAMTVTWKSRVPVVLHETGPMLTIGTVPE